MVARVKLTQEDNFYYLLIYENSDNENPHFLMPFPYNSSNQQKMLEKARQEAQIRAKNLGVFLEENLNPA